MSRSRAATGCGDAVQTWLAAAEDSAGPVFRAVALGGNVSDDALADDSASRIVNRYARRGRPGCRRLPRPQPPIEAGRHRSLDTLRGCVRRVDLFKEHAGAALL